MLHLFILPSEVRGVFFLTVFFNVFSPEPTHVGRKSLIFRHSGGYTKRSRNIFNKEEQRIEIIKDGAENIGDKDTLLTMIEGKEAELREKVRLADSFEFTNFDNESLANLIDKIDCELQILNSKLYESKSNKKRISDSLQTQYPIIDIEKMRDLFDEMHLLFPDGVYKNFEDLLDFNKKLSEERNEYLRGQLSIIDKEIPQLTAQIETLQTRRAEKLSFLTEENSYEKYKEIQRNLNELQNDISDMVVSPLSEAMFFFYNIILLILQ